MEEKVNGAEVCQPQQESADLPPTEEVTTPPEGNAEESFVEVKFNKETKKLTLDQAAALAQKGMKFDMLAEDISRLRSLSKGEGLSLGEYISKLTRESREKRLAELTDKCSGDAQLAEKLLTAEGAAAPDEVAAFRAEFPEIEPDAIPEEVKTAAEIKGTGLLFEYLLYEHRLGRAAAEELAHRKTVEQATLGSLSCQGSRSAADTEFLKGVWGR